MKIFERIINSVQRFSMGEYAGGGVSSLSKLSTSALLSAGSGGADATVRVAVDGHAVDVEDGYEMLVLELFLLVLPSAMVVFLL